MSRGQQSLFNDLVKPLHPPAEKNSDKGRSKALISKRDTRLLYRYYYYAQLQRRQYNDAISLLIEEFDLSERRIIECISEKHSELKQIFTGKPEKKHLEKLYPWLNWSF